MKENPDHFNVLRKIKNKPDSTQRQLAEDLGFSLGKLNYCLKALKAKGLVKIANFKKNPNKANYIYILTPKGIAKKSKLTIKDIFNNAGAKAPKANLLYEFVIEENWATKAINNR